MTILNEWFPLWIGLLVLLLCSLIPFLIPKPHTPDYADLVAGRRRQGSTSFESLNIKKRSVTHPIPPLHPTYSRSPSEGIEEETKGGGRAEGAKKNTKGHAITHDNPDKLLADWEVKVTFLTGSLICCYVMWACAYLAQVNPMITPIYKDVHA
jgi:ATP synthase H subunit